MHFSTRCQELEIADQKVGFRRSEHGVIEIRADDDDGLAAGLGYAHAYDRGVQMLLEDPERRVSSAGRGTIIDHDR